MRAVFPPQPEAFGNSEPQAADQKSGWKKVQKAREKILDTINRGEIPPSRDFKNLWSEYKHLFCQAQFEGKCAFCETRISAAQPGDVEHYRPKTAVCEPLSPGNRDDSGGQSPGRAHGPESHPGYWWLAYEWTNYLYSCATCNRTWKRNSFPVRDPRGTMEPGVEFAEAPLLLNPFQTDPEPHLAFDEFGQIHGLTEEGEITIDRCGLDRQSLINERFRVAQNFDELVAMLGEGLLTPEGFDRLVAKLCTDDAEYAALARSLSAQWLEATLGPDSP